MSDRGMGMGGLTDQEEAIRRGVLNYLESPEFDAVHERLDAYWRPAVAPQPMTTFRSFLSAISLPFGGSQPARDDEARRDRKREVIQRAARSIPVVLYPVLIPPDTTRSPESVGPALYAGTLDATARNTPRLMNEVVREAALAEARTMAAGADSHAYQPHRRRGLIGGLDIQVFDVLLVAAFLPSLPFTPAPLPFLVEPEEGGQVLAAPTLVVAESLRRP